jgi:hypothetical protein
MKTAYRWHSGVGRALIAARAVGYRARGSAHDDADMKVLKVVARHFWTPTGMRSRLS